MCWFCEYTFDLALFLAMWYLTLGVREARESELTADIL